MFGHLRDVCATYELTLNTHHLFEFIKQLISHGQRLLACQFHLAQACFGQRLLSRFASSTWHKHALVSDYYQGLPVPPGAIMLWSAIIIKACKFYLAQACFGQRLVSRLASSTWHKHALVRDYCQGLPVQPGTNMVAKDTRTWFGKCLQ